ncbi:unnamed protein product [Dibothriocephalus latus]|uniref:Uncharacterized protein n=1 Tax=Dibothriocephalus latus TaxID=60516 RepID=A0A3P6VB56_DIBLA|nr:unnamed protein product [Dibothriocephalus latus]
MTLILRRSATNSEAFDTELAKRSQDIINNMNVDFEQLQVLCELGTEIKKMRLHSITYTAVNDWFDEIDENVQCLFGKGPFRETCMFNFLAVNKAKFFQSNHKIERDLW